MKYGIFKSLLLLLLCLVTGLADTGLADLAAQDSGWGHFTGKIVVDGEVPTPADLTLSTDDQRYCEDTGEEYKSRDLLVGSENQLQDVYVMMYFGRRDRKRPEIHPSYAEDEGKVTLDNVNCRFQPRAIFVQTGKSIEFKNSDRIGHNCHIVTMNFEENCSLGAGQSLDVAVEEASRVPGIIKCDAHPWMEALLLVRDEPYVAISDAEGNFRIENIPAGEWTFQFWHAKKGFLKELNMDGKVVVGRRGEMKVTIADGQTNDLGTLSVPAGFMLEDD